MASTIEESAFPDIGPEGVGAMFRAMAALFRAGPWKVIPSDRPLLMSMPDLDLDDAVLLVVDEGEAPRGLVLLAGLEEYDAYIAAGAAVQAGRQPQVPPHFAISFERSADVEQALLQEIAEHDWPVASEEAYPVLVAIDGGAEPPRPPDAGEIEIAEALALVLLQVVADEGLGRALREEAVFERNSVVTTHAGEVDVDLRLLREEELEPPGSLADVLAPDASVEALGERTRRRFQEELVERFSQAPERDHLPEVGWCRLLMDFAVTYFDATVGSLSPRQLYEIIFEIVPRKVSIHASEGRGLLEEARAFYAFLGREFGLAQAQDCLRVIDGDDAVKQLERALSNPSNFGLAKSLVMGTGEFAAPRPKPASKRSSAKGKKDKRKAARKARKKNR